MAAAAMMKVNMPKETVKDVATKALAKIEV